MEKYKNFKKIILIGGSRYNELSPMIPFINICKNKGLDCFLITDQEHINYKCTNYSTFYDELKKTGINFEVTNDIHSEKIKKNTSRTSINIFSQLPLDP